MDLFVLILSAFFRFFSLLFALAPVHGAWSRRWDKWQRSVPNVGLYRKSNKKIVTSALRLIRALESEGRGVSLLKLNNPHEQTVAAVASEKVK